MYFRPREVDLTTIMPIITLIVLNGEPSIMATIRDFCAVITKPFVLSSAEKNN